MSAMSQTCHQHVSNVTQSGLARHMKTMQSDFRRGADVIPVSSSVQSITAPSCNSERITKIGLNLTNL